MKPTNETIKAEIVTLVGMKPRIPKATMFNDDNWGAVEAQLDVLRDNLSSDEIDDGRFNDYARSSAQEARSWMDGDEDSAPSEDWASIAR